MSAHDMIVTLSCPDAVSFAKDIRPLFTDMDVAHMKRARNFDLSNYDDVKIWATQIFNDVSSGRMPPQDSGEPRWTPQMVTLFGCWMKLGYQR